MSLNVSSVAQYVPGVSAVCSPARKIFRYKHVSKNRPNRGYSSTVWYCFFGEEPQHTHFIRSTSAIRNFIEQPRRRGIDANLRTAKGRSSFGGETPEMRASFKHPRIDTDLLRRRTANNNTHNVGTVFFSIGRCGFVYTIWRNKCPRNEFARGLEGP